MKQVSRNWVPRPDTAEITDVEIYTKPQFLPEYVIQDILDVLNDVAKSGACRQANERLVYSLRKNIHKQLKRCKLILVKECIEDVKNTLRIKYFRALAVNGYAAGLIAAMALSSASTQSTMNSFKLASGASLTVEGGISGLTTLIYTNINRKDPRMIVHFNTRMTRNDIIDLRAPLLELRASELVVGYNISKLSPTIQEYKEGTLERFWWHDVFYYHPEKEMYKNVTSSNYVLRLYLDKDLMFARQTTPSEIARAIEEDKVGSVVTVYSPFDLGIIDVIVIPEATQGNPVSESEQITYLKRSVYMELDTLLIKGISGIQQIYPKTYKLSSMISSEKENQEGHFSLSINIKEYKIKESIFPPYHVLERSLVELGMIIIEKKRDSYTNRIVGYIIESQLGSPKKLLEESKLDNYYYMITTGSNLDSILRLPFVDPLRTISNNIFDIASKIGIEASRNYFNYEIQIVLESIKSGDINSRHIDLTADMIYINGKPSGVTYQGNQLRGQGPMTIASGGRGTQSMIQAAINKESEDIINTIPSIITGKEVIMGKKTGILAPTNEIVDEIEKKFTAEKEKRAVILRNTLGIKEEIKNKNLLLRQSLLKKRSSNENQSLEISIQETSAQDTDLKEKYKTEETEETETTEKKETQPVNFLPRVIPTLLSSTLSGFSPLIPSSQPDIAYADIGEISSPIQDVVKSSILHSRSFYSHLFINRQLYRGPNYGNISEIISKHLAIVENRRKESIVVPGPIVDINIYETTFVGEDKSAPGKREILINKGVLVNDTPSDINYNILVTNLGSSLTLSAEPLQSLQARNAGYHDYIVNAYYLLAALTMP